MPHHVVTGLRVSLLERRLDSGSQAVRAGPAGAPVAGGTGKQVGAAFTQLGGCVWCSETLPRDLDLSGTVFPLCVEETAAPLPGGSSATTVLLFSCGTLAD